MIRKTQINSVVRVKIYDVLSERVDDAIRRGIRRAHKHADAPEPDSIVEHVHREVMSDICDLLTFPEFDE
jgi:hypothetical protein